MRINSTWHCFNEFGKEYRCNPKYDMSDCSGATSKDVEYLLHKKTRIDFIGDGKRLPTLQEIANHIRWNSEMHINGDNSCSGYELNNKWKYEDLERDVKTYLSMTWFEKLWRDMLHFRYNTRDYPSKYKYYICDHGIVTLHEDYLGLTNDQIAFVELWRRGGKNAIKSVRNQNIARLRIRFLRYLVRIIERTLIR